MVLANLVSDDDWGSFHAGRPPVLLNGNDSASSNTSAMLYGICFSGFLLLAVIAFVFVYKIIKRSQSNHHKVSFVDFTFFF